jgi:hypothetical protein
MTVTLGAETAGPMAALFSSFGGMDVVQPHVKLLDSEMGF